MKRGRPGDTAGAPLQSRNAQLLLAGAMLLWGLHIPAIKMLVTRFDPLMLAALRMFCACCVFALRRNGQLPRIARSHWGLLFVCNLLLFSGIAATAIGNLIWNRSIGVLGISRTALYLNWVPLFAIAFAVLFLGESMSWWLVLGFACVVSCTWAGTMGCRPPGGQQQ